MIWKCKEKGYVAIGTNNIYIYIFIEITISTPFHEKWDLEPMGVWHFLFSFGNSYININE